MMRIEWSELHDHCQSEFGSEHSARATRVVDHSARKLEGSLVQSHQWPCAANERYATPQLENDSADSVVNVISLPLFYGTVNSQGVSHSRCLLGLPHSCTLKNSHSSLHFRISYFRILTVT